MGDGPMADALEKTESPKLKICECKIGNKWDVQLIERLVGEEKMEEILEVLGNP